MTIRRFVVETTVTTKAVEANSAGDAVDRTLSRLRELHFDVGPQSSVHEVLDDDVD